MNNIKMTNALEVLYSLNGSYSGLFLLFWLTLVGSCLGVWIFESRDSQRAAKIEAVFFWFFGIAMVCFAALRPIGIARDDLAYVEFYKAICPVTDCGKWVQSSRDWGWYTLVGILKSAFDDVRIMLWLGAAALLVKLLVFFSIARRPLPVLLLFASVYYQVQDLTAWRVSLSLAVFLLAVWLIACAKIYLGGLFGIACGLFHKQGFVAPLILLGRFFVGRPLLLMSICLLFLGLVILGLSPDFEIVFSKLDGLAQSALVKNGLESYIQAKAAGIYQASKHAPMVVYPLVLFTLWLMLKADGIRPTLASAMSGCLVMGCFFLWCFGSMIDAQVRFFEFFMMPTVLLAGVRQLKKVEVVALVLICGIFVIKFNVFAHLLTGG